MKVRNEAKHKSIDFGFFPFSGAPKSVWGCKERLFSPFLRILNENSETIPNEIKKNLTFLTCVDLEIWSNLKNTDLNYP